MRVQITGGQRASLMTWTDDLTRRGERGGGQQERRRMAEGGQPVDRMFAAWIGGSVKR